jgi:hypothetical protein
MKSLRSLAGAPLLASALGMIAFSVPAGAQATVSAPTLTGLSNFEQSLTSSSVLPPITSLPPDVLASIAGGALDLRVQTNYNPSASILTLTFFAVQTGSPIPTNLGTVNPASIFGGLTITVDKIYATSKAVMFVGTVSSGSNTPVGNIQGLPATFSFAYSTDKPPKITNAITLVAGTAVLFSAAATGTVNITQPTGGGGGGGASGVTIVVSAGAGSVMVGPNSFQVVSTQVVLDASQSTSTNPGALTYLWTVAPDSQNAGILQNTTATPLILLSGRQTYKFILTVTDATGATATATISVQR